MCMKKILLTIKKRMQEKKGFTLLETLVAVFILTLALTGPIYIASLAIRSSVETRDNITAYYLAEEAIEYIRNERDFNSFKGTQFSWLGDTLGGAIYNCLTMVDATEKKVCNIGIDYNGAYYLSNCDQNVCQPLTFNPNSNAVYGGPVDLNNALYSKFTRQITLDVIDLNSEILVTAKITWEDKGRQREFEIQERLHKQDYERYYAENK